MNTKQIPRSPIEELTDFEFDLLIEVNELKTAIYFLIATIALLLITFLYFVSSVFSS